MKKQDTLFLIPARGGSKGIPNKNIKLLGGKPLIHYSIEIARNFEDDCNICVSTDDLVIKEKVNEIGLELPFIRPADLATDKSSTYDVIMHALDYYKKQDVHYDKIILLQPTSPFRKKEHIKEALALYSNELDMVVSVKESKANPYFNLFEENSMSFLEKSKPGNYTRRQDCPTVYEYNGSIYIINVKSLLGASLGTLQRIRKYVMEPEFSVDLDTPLDWKFAELLISQNGI